MNPERESKRWQPTQRKKEIFLGDPEISGASLQTLRGSAPKGQKEFRGTCLRNARVFELSKPQQESEDALVMRFRENS